MVKKYTFGTAMFDTTAALAAINNFLACPTPEAWVETALAHQDIMLIDHANCEKKAAATALSLIHRYLDKGKLMHQLSRLAREELRHFEQVLAILNKRHIEYSHVTPSRYAGELRKHVRTHEPARLIDTMIIGAFIEARSCERFAMLVPHLDTELAEFYAGLVKVESRHFTGYLALAELYANEPLDDRIAYFAEIEAELIRSPDREFRFHSGVF